MKVKETYRGVIYEIIPEEQLSLDDKLAAIEKLRKDAHGAIDNALEKMLPIPFPKKTPSVPSSTPPSNNA